MPVSAWISDEHPGHPAADCIDGDITNHCTNLSPSNVRHPWITLDLGAAKEVTSVIIAHRQPFGKGGTTEYCCTNRILDLDFRVSDDPPATGNVPFRGGTRLGFIDKGGKNGGSTTLVAPKPLVGRYVVIINNSKGKYNGNANFNGIAEIYVFGSSQPYKCPSK